MLLRNLCDAEQRVEPRRLPSECRDVQISGAWPHLPENVSDIFSIQRSVIAARLADPEPDYYMPEEMRHEALENLAENRDFYPTTTCSGYRPTPAFRIC